MHRLTARPALVTLALCGAFLSTSCGRSSVPTQATPAGDPAPVLGAPDRAPGPAVALVPPVSATKNTTRISGEDPVAVAAAVARTVFPGTARAERPQAVAVVDRRDWRTALAASVLMSPPTRAPLLFSDAGQDLPDASAAALEALNPTGSKAAGGAQVIRVGSVPRPKGRKTTDITGRDPFALAAAIDATLSAARGKTGDRVLIVSAESPAYAAPAAAYAAKSGDTILFTRRATLPAATRAALALHQQPKIFVLGPTRVVGPAVTGELRKLGTVTRIGGPTPVANAIAFASFAATDFGWGVVDPGHGLVFQPAGADPATPAAAAPLSASGTYGPLLLLPGGVQAGKALDPTVVTYLKSIQPGFRSDPVRGVYNHGWLIGTVDAITPEIQAQLDSLLEIMRADTAKASS